MKFNNTLMLSVQADLNTGLIPMLLGEPGIGKSSWLEALASKMNTKCFTLACNQLADKADLTGARLVPITDKNGNTDYKQMFYPHAVIHDAITYANENPQETPILFLDELNRTTPDVTSATLSIPTMRHIGSKQLPDNLRIVIAGNDKGNVSSLDDASISRFVLYHVEPDTDTFLDVNDNLNVFVKQVLEENPEMIFTKFLDNKKKSRSDYDDDEIYGYDEDQMQQLTTPRTITAVSDWLNSMSPDEIVEIKNTIVRINDADPLANTGNLRSALELAIHSHTGNTMFSRYLYEKIIKGSIQYQNRSRNAVYKPEQYDDIVRNFNNGEEYLIPQPIELRELFHNFVFALCDGFHPKLATLLYDILVDSKFKFDQDCLNTLAQLKKNNRLVKANIDMWGAANQTRMNNDLRRILF